MDRLRTRLSYSNVMVTILAVLVLGGGTAYAASQMLPKNSVGAKQIKKEAVTPAKLSKAAKVALTGPPGPQGAAGAQGPAGPQGPPGAATTVTPAELPHARIRLRTHEKTVPNNEQSRVSFDDVVEDNAGMADLTNHPTALLAPRTGLYLVAANLEWFDLEGEGRVGGEIEVPTPDGVGFVPDKSQVVFDYTNSLPQFLAQPLSEVIRLDAGQYVTLATYQATGQTNKLTDTDDGTWLEMTYLGP
jgi:hypothetical protein